MVNRSASEWEQFHGKKYVVREEAGHGRHWGRDPLKIGDVYQLRGDYRHYRHKIVKLRGVYVSDEGYVFANVAFLGPNVVSRNPSPVDDDGFATVAMCGVFPHNLRLLP
jgi:hypothetical protein